MNSPANKVPDGPLSEKLAALRAAADRSRLRASWILAITAGVLIAGGWVFFTASQIVADDKTRIVEEQLKKISALNEQAEKARAAAVTAQQESERARARIEESEKRANIIQGRMEATKVEAEKAVEELRRSLASMKK